MKKLFILLILSFSSQVNFAQGLTNFDIEIEEFTISGMPALQSFAWGKTTDGKWVLLSGRTDGLHDHRPPFSFPASLANDDIWVVDPITKQVWSAPINSLSTNLKNALTATNAEFQQVDDVLYIIGGYGVSLTTNQHETFKTITAVDLTPLASAIVNNQAISSHFRQIIDSRFQVTGGYLHTIGNDFYLVGGQDFDGRYNPHNGPSFTQVYTESIKKFNIIDNGSTLQISNYVETVDATNLHRRDYNMAPQIFPNGDTGLTVFTGVFQEIIDIPFFNTVDITSAGHTPRNNFAQLLNQYHTAHAPFYDAQSNNMHTVFFGGIGMYYHDPLGVLVSDSAVPFVKTISRITRFADDSMVEIAMPQSMPGFLGASAEFIPSDSVNLLADAIIDLNAINGKTLVGYIVGGIESTTPNVFMFSGGSSQASNRIFKVYLKSGSIGMDESLNEPFEFDVYPNPSNGVYTIHRENENVNVVLYNDIGEKLMQLPTQGEKLNLDITDRPNGIYYLNFRMGNYSRVSTIVKE